MRLFQLPLVASSNAYRSSFATDLLVSSVSSYSTYSHELLRRRLVHSGCIIDAYQSLAQRLPFFSSSFPHEPQPRNRSHNFLHASLSRSHYSTKRLRRRLARKHYHISSHAATNPISNTVQLATLGILRSTQRRQYYASLHHPQSLAHLTQRGLPHCR